MNNVASPKTLLVSDISINNNHEIQQEIVLNYQIFFYKH